MVILFFGTYDERTHPRVRALREGFRALGHDVEVRNVPLRLSTADRVRAAQQPWRTPLVIGRVVRSWWWLWRRSRGVAADAVVVGYLGHLDVHLARRRFPQTPLVLDHMVSLGDTVRDRGLSPGSPVSRLLDRVDRAALRAADLVITDTSEQLAALPAEPRRSVVVPVVAPRAWHDVQPSPTPSPGEPLRVVFYGLFTPLQGTPTIGRALARLADRDDIHVTMIGTGQGHDETRDLAAANRHVRWIDWIDGDALPEMVATHQVCLGIFGTGPKARRVLPNKVVQGATAGCAVITSDTAVQRRLLGALGTLVPAGDDLALAAAIEALADDRTALDETRRATRAVVDEALTPSSGVAELASVVAELVDAADRR